MSKRIKSRFLDSVVAILIFIFTCFYWRGSWDTIGAYILPNKEPINCWVQSSIGLGTFIMYLIAPHVRTALHGKGQITYILGTRTFCIIQGSIYMIQWRGGWTLADYYLPKGPLWGLLGFFIPYLLLLILGCTRQVIFPPYGFTVDTEENMLQVSNRFRTTVSNPS